MDRSVLQGRRIGLGVGGGIAAYKAAELVRALQRAGAQVRVSMTPAATSFVTPLTFQALSGHPVLTDILDASQEAAFGHIEFARWSELFVVAPATADLLARMVAGMGNDALAATLLAYRGTVLLAPAMNTAMWEHAATQRNLAVLAKDVRYRFVGPGAGLLACGEVGSGRLSEPEQIVGAAAELFAEGPLAGARVLVTAGPTREFLDPVRFISNPSTGKMGLAVARAARARGARVTVVLGPVTGVDRTGLEIVDVVTAEDMRDAVLSRLAQTDVLVATAAVSDWRPAHRAEQKLKKDDPAADAPLELLRTPDVLALAAERVRGLPHRPLLVGFAAETENVVENATAKLLRKGLDLIVANDVTRPDAGFAADTNSVVIVDRAGGRLELSGTKDAVSAGLWDRIAALRSAPALAAP
ncbi:MAG TPA: bifunctional phosphopantothenoylcysteine decarboxylase/phosphopantothenate--cysteine ligase CoaBC [Myxococcaceae bacterium]|nr:bifunctional phosphopantothenoylcysteine decarboxylase/phosphopantothenate--cysteine ligase CoaBC [Myxococcaceae bacterium]